MALLVTIHSRWLIQCKYITFLRPNSTTTGAAAEIVLGAYGRVCLSHSLCHWASTCGRASLMLIEAAGHFLWYCHFLLFCLCCTYVQYDCMSVNSVHAFLSARVVCVFVCLLHALRTCVWVSGSVCLYISYFMYVSMCMYSNKTDLLCVCARARPSVRVRVRVCACVCVWVWVCWGSHCIRRVCKFDTGCRRRTAGIALHAAC